MFEQFENPMGTEGFAFLEFCSLEPKKLEDDFIKMGFSLGSFSHDKSILIYQQNDIKFLVNTSHGHAKEFAKLHGPSVCGMGFRVKDADAAHARAIKLGARNATAGKTINIPAIYGVGDSLLYFLDNKYETKLIKEFLSNPDHTTNNTGLTYIDHVTHNVHRGEMDKWADFYEGLFNFREIRYFDIKGKLTGLTSRALTSPCNKIRIPLNQSSDDKSQIEEFLREYNGEGIQHIALGTSDIYTTIEKLRSHHLKFLDTPDAYFEMVDERLPGHGEDLARLQKNKIIIDGTTKSERKLLLQIFTENMIGPVFFEIIQRKGDEGFGEGNFTALFVAMERDQIKRGTLKG